MFARPERPAMKPTSGIDTPIRPPNALAPVMAVVSEKLLRLE